MNITDEVLEISNDAIEAIVEVGAIITLKSVMVPTESDRNVIVEGDIKDAYANYYSQTKDSNPVIEKEYQLNTVLTYNPSIDKLKTSGLDESCSVVAMIATYQLIEKGFVSIDADFHDIITKLKRNMLIDINGKLFSISSVGMVGNMHGFSIICNLGCDVYG